jgi:hypothetical protein
MSERDDLTEQAYHAPEIRVEPQFVELGGQLFNEKEWEVIQAYAKGHTISAIHDEGLDMQQGVKAFHAAMGQPVGTTAQPLPQDRVAVRVELIREEFVDELIPALYEGDMVETADACIDLLYVVLGLLVEMGIDAGPLFREVQDSNMSKLGADGKGIIAGPNDPDGIFEGRVKKGPNYFRPNLKAILESGRADLEKGTC